MKAAAIEKAPGTRDSKGLETHTTNNIDLATAQREGQAFATLAASRRWGTSDPIEHFRLTIAAAGLTPPDTINPDGAVHRFSTNGRRGDDSGWYVLHTDGIAAGAFGCWRSGLQFTWCAKSGKQINTAELDSHRQRIKAMQVQRDAERAACQESAATNAARRWTAATPCTRHDYLTRKGIQPHGAKIEGDKLLIPMRDTVGTVHSLQTIAPDGTKMFMSGGKVKGCYFGIGKPKGALIVCEGFSTGASIHECTGHAVAVAFNAGNLEAVAVGLRNKYPNLRKLCKIPFDLC